MVNDFPIPIGPIQGGLSPLHVVGAGEVDLIASFRMGRSMFDSTTGITGSLKQLSVNISFCGSTAVFAGLRTGTDGEFNSSPGLDGAIGTKDNHLPFNSSTYFTGAEMVGLNTANGVHPVVSTKHFAAGEVRANETAELTTLQNLFMRNHNLIASLLNEARRLNAAQDQKIVYEQYLPALLGVLESNELEETLAPPAPQYCSG